MAKTFLNQVEHAIKAFSITQLATPNSGIKEKMKLSVIIPTFNEFNYIKQTLDSIQSAEFPFTYEILVFDGGSNDGTRDILEKYAKDWNELKLYDNELTKQVYALNKALTIAQGEYIIRCDAHSLYPKDYFKNLVNFLENNKDKSFGNIGTTYSTSALSSNNFRLGISDAMQHPVGIGGSHRSSKVIDGYKEVDTVLFGAWPAKVFKDVGLFNENFERGQDYEHNLRLRKNGYLVAQVPGTPFTYFTRNKFKKLAKMIFQYSYVKGQILCRDKTAPNLRSYLPALALLFLSLAFVVNPYLALLLATTYFFVITGAGLSNYLKHKDWKRTLGFLVSLPLMHFSHALGVYKATIDYSVFGQRANKMESTR